VRRLSVLIFGAGLLACGNSPFPETDGAPGQSTADTASFHEYTLDNAVINESSGLARSQKQVGLLWTLNDSGGMAALYAVDTEGRYQGTLNVQGAANVDWEDLASFTEDGNPMLLAADVGDNYAVAPFVTLYIVNEPDISSAARPFALTAAPVRSLVVRYPDGARDCEAVAVDAVEGAVYLLSKRDSVPRLYRVPLVPVLPVITAEFLTEINIPRAAADHPNPNGFNWVTAMDFSPDGSRLLVNTLERGYVYERMTGESWVTAMQRAPFSFDLPDYSQIEAGTVAWDGASYYITSENLPARMARLPLP
jgi:hypothetical protein